jgi:putative ABC transport system permease protein
MVATESVVIAGFGGLLGLGVGTILGVALTYALKDQGFSEIDVPEIRLVVFFVVALLAGVLAALWPALRAARLNVLQAIAAE